MRRTAPIASAAPPSRGTCAYRGCMSQTEREHTDDIAAHWERIVADLSDLELREELMVAAMARGERRIDRFRVLLRERHRRQALHH